MTAIDWTGIYKRYAGQWVAIDAEDELTVVAANGDACRPWRVIGRVRLGPAVLETAFIGAIIAMIVAIPVGLMSAILPT